MGSSADEGGRGVRRAPGARTGKGVRVGRGTGVRIGAVGRGLCSAAGTGADGRLAAGPLLGVDSGLGFTLALAAGINVPTGRQLGMPSRQTSAPSPSLPERRARMSCSIVISTNSVPPRSTYQRGLSVGAMDGCRCRAGAGAGTDAAAGGTVCRVPRGTGRDTRSSSSTRLGCAERLRPRPLIAATAASEPSMCVASSSSMRSSSRALTNSIGGDAALAERRSASARSSRTKCPHSQRKTRSLRACSPFVT